MLLNKGGDVHHFSGEDPLQLIPMFYGDSSYGNETERFIHTLNEVAKDHCWTDTYKRYVLEYKLAPKVKGIYFAGLGCDNTLGIQERIAEFSRLFDKTLRPIERRQKFFSCAQGKEESVMEFKLRLIAAATIFRDMLKNDQETYYAMLADQFLFGLKLELRFELEKKGCTEFKEMVEYALKLEELFDYYKKKGLVVNTLCNHDEISDMRREIKRLRDIVERTRAKEGESISNLYHCKDEDNHKNMGRFKNPTNRSNSTKLGINYNQEYVDGTKENIKRSDNQKAVVFDTKISDAWYDPTKSIYHGKGNELVCSNMYENLEVEEMEQEDSDEGDYSRTVKADRSKQNKFNNRTSHKKKFSNRSYRFRNQRDNRVDEFFLDIDKLRCDKKVLVVLKSHGKYRNMPIIHIKVFNREIRALYDTGATSTVIDEKFLLPSDPTRGCKMVYLESPLVNHSVEAYKTGVQIDLGGTTVMHTVCVGPLEGGGNFQMIIGFDFLKRYDAIFDIKNNNILFSLHNDNDWESEFSDIPVGAASECLYLADKRKGEGSEGLLEILNIGEFKIGNVLRAKFRDIVLKHQSIMIEDVTCLKGATVAPYKPKFLSDKPIYQRQYRFPHAMLGPLRKKIDAFEKANIIKRTESPWNTPILVIPKNNNTDIRLVMDLRKLNEVIEPIPYPLIRIDDVLSKLAGSQYFSKLDLNNGFYQIALEEEVKNRFCFTTPWGRYSMQKLPQGLVTAAALFQKVMNEAFHELIGQGKVLIYQDDVLVHTATAEEHLEVLNKLFLKLESIQLAVRPSKCIFFSKQVVFLGHIIDGNGSRPTQQNVEAINDLQRPRTVKQVRSFMGSINFYRNYIKGVTDMAAPLYELIKKGQTKINWTDSCQEAFVLLKQALISAPVLVHPNYEFPFIIKSDASNISIGAVLEQEIKGELHPVAYCSRKLNKAERNYSVIEREALATVYALQQFRYYVYGYEILLYTDHKPLSYVFALKDTNQRLMRWMLQIQDFRLKIQHIPGKFNLVADMLSRKVEAEEKIQVSAIKRVSEVISNQYIKTAQRKDAHCLQLIKKISDGEFKDDEYILDENGILLKQVFPERVSGWKFRVLVPISIKNKIISNYHDQVYAGHYSVNKVMWKVKQLFTWDRMYADIFEYVRTCERCQRRNLHRTKAPFQAVKPPTFPMQRLSCDLMGPFVRTKKGNKYLVVWCDHFSRYCWASPVPNMEAATIAQDYIENIFSRYGASKEIITDRGANFTSGLFTSLCSKLGAKNITTTSFRPCSNGVSERLNSKILAVLSHICNRYFSDWDSVLPYALLSIRSTVHRSTGESPMYLLHCFDAIDPLVEQSVTVEREFASPHEFVEQVTARIEIARAAIASRLVKSSELNCLARNSGRRIREFEVGDKVLFLDSTSFSGKNRKLKERFIGPYRIVERLGLVNFKIRDVKNTSKVKTIHIDKLKPYFDREMFDDEDKGGQSSKNDGNRYQKSYSRDLATDIEADQDDETDDTYYIGRRDRGNHEEEDNNNEEDNMYDQQCNHDELNLDNVMSKEDQLKDIVIDKEVVNGEGEELELDKADQITTSEELNQNSEGAREEQDKDVNLRGKCELEQSEPRTNFRDAGSSEITKGSPLEVLREGGGYNLRSKITLPHDFFSQTGYLPIREKRKDKDN